MKRVLVLVLALVLCLGLVGCGNSSPSLEELVEQADQIVRDYDPELTGSYQFTSLGYQEDDIAYMVAMTVDMDAVAVRMELAEVPAYLESQVLSLVLDEYEQSEEIAPAMDDLKLLLDETFADTDVDVIIAFFDRNTKILQMT